MFCLGLGDTFLMRRNALPNPYCDELSNSSSLILGLNTLLMCYTNVIQHLLIHPTKTSLNFDLQRTLGRYDFYRHMFIERASLGQTELALIAYNSRMAIFHGNRLHFFYEHSLINIIRTIVVGIQRSQLGNLFLMHIHLNHARSRSEIFR